MEPSIQHENGGLEAPIPDGNKLPTEGSVTELTNETVSEGRPVSERPLVLYAYADSESHSSLVNLKFFIQHGLHDAADFIFILNGETTAGFLIPQEDNIRVVQRANDCYDLGAYAEILTTNDLYKGYKKFIMLNASIRGPFLPSWSNTCWMDMYLGRVTDEVKVYPSSISFKIKALTTSQACRNDSKLLANFPYPIYDLGYRYYWTYDSPLPT